MVKQLPFRNIVSVNKWIADVNWYLKSWIKQRKVKANLEKVSSNTYCFPNIIQLILFLSIIELQLIDIAFNIPNKNNTYAIHNTIIMHNTNTTWQTISASKWSLCDTCHMLMHEAIIHNWHGLISEATHQSTHPLCLKFKIIFYQTWHNPRWSNSLLKPPSTFLLQEIYVKPQAFKDVPVLKKKRRKLKHSSIFWLQKYTLLLTICWWAT